MALVLGSQTILPFSLETGQMAPFPALCYDLSPAPQSSFACANAKSPPSSASKPLHPQVAQNQPQEPSRGQMPFHSIWNFLIPFPSPQIPFPIKIFSLLL